MTDDSIHNLVLQQVRHAAREELGEASAAAFAHLRRAQRPLVSEMDKVWAHLEGLSDGLLGLRLVQHYRFSHPDFLTVKALVMQGRPTVLRAARVFSQHYALASTAAELDIAVDGGRTSIQVRFSPGPRPSTLRQSTVGGVYIALCQLLDDHIDLKALHLAMPLPPSVVSKAEAFWGCPIRSGVGVDALVLTTEEASRERLVPTQCAPAATPEVHQQTRQTLSTLEQNDLTFEEVCRREMAWMFPQWPTLNALADNLGLSARGLQRRLAKYGVSFRQLRTQSMAARADELLRSGLQVQTVAALLGYSEVAAFSRAFTAATGGPPSKVRPKEVRLQVPATTLSPAHRRRNA